MDPSRWRKIEDLFHKASARPANERAAFLADACGDDEDLRRQIESLLATRATADGLFAEPALAFAARAVGDADPPILSGRTLGIYLLGERIGRGGMGDVYRARDTRLGRHVAVKILPPEFASDADRLARFEREARVLALLNHPNIATVHGVEERDGVRALVMELVEGETLADRIARGPIPLPAALTIARQIGEALAAAHDRGVVHRDLKPANVMLTKGGVKLLDFGLAKLTRPAGHPESLDVAADARTHGTKPGAILGTVHYMAPEQVEGREADARSDIWSLGATIFEMLTGSPPFGGSSPASVMGSILRDVPPSISSALSRGPMALDHLVATCLAKDPDTRWQSAADVVHALHLVSESTQAVPEPRRSPTPWPWAIAGAVALVAAALSVSALWRPSTDRGFGPVTRLDVVTGLSGIPSIFALSLDGRQLAYVSEENGVERLWIRRLDDTIARPIAGTDEAMYPFWSPDGRSVGFFAQGKLKVADLSDGTLRTLADASSPLGGTWNADGVILFAPALRGPLMRVSSSGGPSVAATQGNGDRWPQFLPDGRRFLYFAVQDFEPRGGGTYLGVLDGSESRKVIGSQSAAYYAHPDSLFSVEAGRLVAYPFDLDSGVVTGEAVAMGPASDQQVYGFFGAFAVSNGGVVAHRLADPSARQLTWMGRDGRTLGTVGPPDHDSLASPSISPDGSLVAVGRQVAGNRDVWTIDVSRGVVSRVTVDPGSQNVPIWAPDGRLFYTSLLATGVGGHVAAGGLDGRAERIVDLGVPQSVSSDGATLVFTMTRPGTRVDIWAMPLVGRGPPYPVVQTEADDVRAQLSPDGRWLAYDSAVSGRPEVYVQAFPQARERWQVSRNGGAQVRWSRNGRELFYVAADQQLTAVSFTPSAKAPVLGPGVPLFRVKLAIGPNIANTANFLKAQYDVAADGRFLINGPAEGARMNPINVILNWPALLDAEKSLRAGYDLRAR